MKNLTTQLPGLIAAVHAAEYGSFSAAARALNITPAAVGKSVAQLEARLGVRLFNRTTRTLTPTEEGQRLVAQARTGLDALALAHEVAQPQTGSGSHAVHGLVRINSAAEFGRRYLLPLLPALMERHPRLSIDLVLSDQTVDLVRDRFDLGVRGGQEPPQGMVARVVCELPTVLVASKTYLKHRGLPTTPEMLSEHRLIGLRFLSGRVSAWPFRQGGRRWAVEPEAALWLSSPEAVLDAAVMGMGIAQVGLHHAWEALHSGRLQQLLKSHHAPSLVPFSLFYPHRTGLAPRVRVVLDHLWTGLRAEPQLMARKMG